MKTESPIPRYDLFKKKIMLPLQCNFQEAALLTVIFVMKEHCMVTIQTKTVDQIIKEFETIYSLVTEVLCLL